MGFHAPLWRKAWGEGDLARDALTLPQGGSILRDLWRNPNVPEPESAWTQMNSAQRVALVFLDVPFGPLIGFMFKAIGAFILGSLPYVIALWFIWAMATY